VICRQKTVRYARTLYCHENRVTAPKNPPPHHAAHAKSKRFLFHPNELRFLEFLFPKTPSRSSTCHRKFFCRNWATTCAISNFCLRFIVKRFPPAAAPIPTEVPNHKDTKTTKQITLNVAFVPFVALWLSRICTYESFSSNLLRVLRSLLFKIFRCPCSQIVPKSFTFPRIHEYWNTKRVF